MNTSEQLNQQDSADTSKELMVFVANLYRGDGENVLNLRERRDRIYEECPSKKDIDQGIEVLNQKIAEMRNRLEEHGQMDKDSARKELDEKMEECMKLNTAIAALGEDNELAPPMVSRAQILKDEVDKIAKSLDCSGVQENIDFLGSVLSDFQSVTKYFERTARTISNVQQDLTEIPTRLSVPMPLSANVAASDIEVRRNAVKRYIKRLRQHEIISRPGSGESGEYLNEGEMLQDRIVEFFGGEVEQDVERYEIGFEPDREEVSMALFFAGAEDTPANRSVYRSKLKTGEMQMFRQQVADLMKKKKETSGFGSCDQFVEYMCKTLLAKMPSATDKDRETMQFTIVKALKNEESSAYANLVGSDAIAKDMNIIGYAIENSFIRNGGVFRSDSLKSLAIARLFGLSQKKKKTLSESETEKRNNEVKVIISEFLPFVNYYVAKNGINDVKMLLDGFDEVTPGFVSFTNAEGLFVNEDLEGTSGKDAYNLVLFEAFQKGLSIHNAEKEAEALKNRKDSLRRSLDNNVGNVRLGVKEAVESYDKLLRKKGEHDVAKATLEEDKKLIEEVNSVQILFDVIDNLRRLGVKGITDKELEWLDLESGMLIEADDQDGLIVNSSVIDYIIGMANVKVSAWFGLGNKATIEEITLLMDQLGSFNKQNYPLFFHGRDEVVNISGVLRTISKTEKNVENLFDEMGEYEKDFVKRMDWLASCLKAREKMRVDAEELLDGFEDNKWYELPINEYSPRVGSRNGVLGELIIELWGPYIDLSDEEVMEFKRLKILGVFIKEN